MHDHTMTTGINYIQLNPQENTIGTQVEDGVHESRKGPDEDLTKLMHGDVEQYAYSAIFEILSAAKILHQKLVATEAISFAEFRILMRLERAEKAGGFVIQEHLVKELGLSPSRISKILDALDASFSLPGRRQVQGGKPRAWIMRTDARANRRQKVVSLTDEGKKILNCARPYYTRQIYKAVKAVGLRDLLQMRISLLCLNNALDPRHIAMNIGLRGVSHANT
jgi:DNA-binding MarR family transcriptional regulator